MMHRLGHCWIVLLCAQGAAFAQNALTLAEAVERAQRNYPSVRASVAQASAAAAGVKLARTSYLPQADFLAQMNRATRNNVFGMLLPQSVIPSISGPTLATNSATNVWGTAAGFLVSWEPFDFGLRKANVDAAEVARRHAEAGIERTRLEVGITAADAFLTILAAEQQVRSAQATVARGRALSTVVDALVNAQLRPGADGERTRAEIALAETQLIQSEQALAVARAALAQMLGTAPNDLRAQPGRLFEPPPASAIVESPIDEHPAMREQSAAIDEAKARIAALDRAWYPKFLLQGALYARGTGAMPNGTTGGAVSGLGPNIHNWGIGFTVRFPLLEEPSIKAKREAEAAREEVETARYDEARREFHGQLEKAKAMLDGARRSLRQAPIQLQAARAVEQQATARYRAGLASIVEVAEAQRLLAQADVDNALARLGVWRAMLAVAASQGNLDQFLQQVR